MKFTVSIQIDGTTITILPTLTAKSWLELHKVEIKEIKFQDKTYQAL